tara:strand:+ start:485 stop:985 length:501 start_codon:yes stop_codon:yes gene_type:complete
MAKNRKYTVRLKRKRRGKTDYKLRLKLLKSNKPRLIIRKSIKNMLVQIVKSENSQDKVLTSCNGNEIKKLGWNQNLGNIPSSYLIGLLIGKKALKKDIKEVILDLGLQKAVIKSRLYAALKGCIDAGVNIAHNPKIFPSEERIKGSHINKGKENNFEEIKKKIENG